MSTEMKEYVVVYSVPVAFLLFLLNAYMYMYVPVHTVTLPASLVVLVRGGDEMVLDKPCLRRGSQQLAVVLHTHVQELSKLCTVAVITILRVQAPLQ